MCAALSQRKLVRLLLPFGRSIELDRLPFQTGLRHEPKEPTPGIETGPACVLLPRNHLASGHPTAANLDVPNGHRFIALLEAVRETGGTAPGETVGRLLDERQSGASVSHGQAHIVEARIDIRRHGWQRQSVTRATRSTW